MRPKTKWGEATTMAMMGAGVKEGAEREGKMRWSEAMAARIGCSTAGERDQVTIKTWGKRKGINARDLRSAASRRRTTMTTAYSESLACSMMTKMKKRCDRRFECLPLERHGADCPPPRRKRKRRMQRERAVALALSTIARPTGEAGRMRMMREIEAGGKPINRPAARNPPRKDLGMEGGGRRKRGGG